MKSNTIKKLMTLSTVLALCLVLSCSDFLDVKPQGVVDNSYNYTRNGAEALLIGAYSLLDGVAESITGWEGAASNWVYGGIAGGDAHKGTDEGDQPDINPIERYESSAVNSFFNGKWSVLYDGINRSNHVISALSKVPDATPEIKTRIRAEARVLRGHYHFEAKKMWKDIPYISETAPDPTKVKNDVDAWPFIEADLKFGYDSLPEEMDAVGRINKWVAAALLAKCYMYQGQFDKALPVLNDIINNGVNPLGVKFDLEPNYQSNFNAAKKNSAESVFAVQSSVNDGGNAYNGNYGDVLNFPYGGGPAGCCGFFQPSQDLVNSFRTDDNGLPLLDGTQNLPANAVISDDGIGSDEPFTPDAGSLDPRLDWTVGRRGIPYLDWGLHPGASWIRKQSYGGPYSAIKSSYYQTQSGTYTDQSSWTEGWTAINYNIIRFADVLLWRAEALAESEQLAEAMVDVNRVRSRMKDHPEHWVKMDDGSNAANYVIDLYSAFPDKDFANKAIHMERRIELGMEGHRFFDLVRWGVSDQVINDYLAYESMMRNYLEGATFDKGVDEYYPIPQRQIDLSGTNILKQNTGH